ncbi:putative transcription factor B3-Domain family [Helianthus annuus]|uniref:Putative DNA-binding pseudobarrel domain-containing protein n=1 Tax=Helianthus annuus TaxID=4232 RepID=A0A251T4Z9_HELAN|nr:B3 domain-containing transcription factor VRN1 [Helianthus annuus]KAF5779383.1 putative transcription factor B3-Domain family [Helianthus annuus]KAJ0490649.1 putative transcription factor B3-Domain family [Helianthus annuus]KAJ0506568.1 putative transcription factor B3-Domain family [Helianthus annuus]KAJ0676244.1 putative transcription factor B3-Domain family [Helianthus annuus]KAJ0679471.1 putative transcription factor B3-Domain family [Helianthus annuus]
MRSHRKLRNFYRFITSDTDQTGLKIPKKFTKDHRKQILLNNNVLLIVSDDKVWHLGWTVSDDGKLWLQKGWPEFHKHYCLKFGHLLVFKHLGKSKFHVRIFDPGYIELYNLQPEKEIESKRSFTVTVRYAYLRSSMLYVPVRFYRRCLGGYKKNVRCVLQMAQGGSWGGVNCRVVNKSRAGLYGQNWKKFSDENHLGLGDVCVFELINDVENVMKVTISRACGDE